MSTFPNSATRFPLEAELRRPNYSGLSGRNLRLIMGTKILTLTSKEPRNRLSLGMVL